LSDLGDSGGYEMPRQAVGFDGDPDVASVVLGDEDDPEGTCCCRFGSDCTGANGICTVSMFGVGLFTNVPRLEKNTISSFEEI
jgi:hypothetical protein